MIKSAGGWCDQSPGGGVLWLRGHTQQPQLWVQHTDPQAIGRDTLTAPDPRGRQMSPCAWHLCPLLSIPTTPRSLPSGSSCRRPLACSPSWLPCRASPPFTVLLTCLPARASCSWEPAPSSTVHAPLCPQGLVTSPPRPDGAWDLGIRRPCSVCPAMATVHGMEHGADEGPCSEGPTLHPPHPPRESSPCPCSALPGTPPPSGHRTTGPACLPGWVCPQLHFPGRALPAPVDGHGCGLGSTLGPTRPGSVVAHIPGEAQPRLAPLAGSMTPSKSLGSLGPTQWQLHTVISLCLHTAGSERYLAVGTVPARRAWRLGWGCQLGSMASSGADGGSSSLARAQPPAGPKPAGLNRPLSGSIHWKCYLRTSGLAPRAFVQHCVCQTQPFHA